MGVEGGKACAQGNCQIQTNEEMQLPYHLGGELVRISFCQFSLSPTPGMDKHKIKLEKEPS